jgi:pyruvate/2-oxoglutarate dehydrogenase complex dihydrolipoamide acyltransferase (E2) component
MQKTPEHALVPSLPADDQVTSLPHGERWFIDGFSVIPAPRGIVTKLCDATRIKQTLHILRQRGLPATYTQIFVRAVALGLRRVPQAHKLFAGYRRLSPATIDIGLSVAGRTNYAPVLVIPRADEQNLAELAQFLHQAVPATREKEVRDLEGMLRTGWVIPFGAVRRFILRLLQKMFWFRRKLVGTIQVTCMPQIDQVYALTMYSSAAIGFGRIADRVLAVDGRPEVRPGVWLTLALDHLAIDGKTAGDLLSAVVDILESDLLVKEAEEAGTAGTITHAVPVLRERSSAA